MDFGKAIEALKKGELVARKGWNGKNMYIYLEDAMHAVFGHPYGKVGREYDPCIVMFTAQGHHQAGWLASQADILAEDWEIVQGQ